MNSYIKWLSFLLFTTVLLALSGCSKSKTEQQKTFLSSGVAPQIETKVNQKAIDIQKPHPKEFLQITLPSRQSQTIILYSNPVNQVPKIDGKSIDTVWNGAEAITTLDYASGRPITIKSVHTNDMIYFLVKFPDVSPSTTQKSFGWDYQDAIYKQLNDREDVFVLKWSLSGNGIDLSYRNPMPYSADVWYWKACRTDPTRYADDKIQKLQQAPNKDFKKIPFSGQIDQYLYLERKGDVGTPAYSFRILFDYQGDIQPQFLNRQPSGSRADVRAKGVWKDGYWTVEFARKLNTGHKDDIQFQTGKKYLFGAATSELAFDAPNPEFSVPLFRSGDVFDRLILDVR